MKRKIPFKAWLLLPALLVPLSFALFYGFGGGQDQPTATEKQQGLNTSLPSSSDDLNNPLDKFSLYKKAEADSLRLAQQQAADPLFSPDTTTSPVYAATALPITHHGLTFPSNRKSPDATVVQVEEKLADLQRSLQQPPMPPPVALSINEQGTFSGQAPSTSTQHNTSMDPELQQINAIMEKVLDVQHPERVTQKLQEQSRAEKSKVFPVGTLPDPPVAEYFPITTVANPPTTAAIFYEWHATTAAASVTNAVRAVVHETKTVLSGATIKLRLEQDLFIQGVQIPTGHFVYGKGNLSADRYTISITDIRYQDAVFPVNLEVLGMDGLPGIFIEGAIAREVLRTGANDGLQNIQLSSLDPSLKAQAAAATVETAKSFLGRKMRLTNITLKAGEPVLLKDTHQ